MAMPLHASFHMFPCSSPIWGKHGKERYLSPFIHPWRGFTGKMWCWVMKTDRSGTWLNKFLGAGGGLASFSCPSVLPIPYCLSGYWRGKEAGDSCQNLSLATVLAAETGNAKLISRSEAGRGKVVFISGPGHFPELQPHFTTANILLTIRENKEKPLCIARQLHHLGQITPISSETNNPELHVFLGHSHLLQQLELEFPWQDKQKCQKSLAGHWEDEPKQVEAQLSHPKSWHEPDVVHEGLGWTSLLQGWILEITSGPFWLLFQLNVSLMHLSTISNHIFNTTEFMLQQTLAIIHFFH